MAGQDSYADAVGRPNLGSGIAGISTVLRSVPITLLVFIEMLGKHRPDGISAIASAV